MIVEGLSSVYGAAATWRRRWYAARASRTSHLSQPVISIGNLCVGGTGKTPAAACIARLLLDHAEHPAILSRGYARRKASPGVTVVSDRDRVLADVAHSGDEPMLLARALPGVPVFVCPDRYLAGRQAETQFGATVHLLDDGFQHVRLARDVDLLLVDESDLDDRVLPAGRLREPITNASVADAVIVPGASEREARTIAERLGVHQAFAMSRALGSLSMLRTADTRPPEGAPLFAVAGIARPERFFDDLRAAGLNVVGSMVFGDHHAFTPEDVGRIGAAARSSGAVLVVTTEKDAVRLEEMALPAIPFAAVPLQTRIEPADAFASWLMGRLALARQHRGGASR